MRATVILPLHNDRYLIQMSTVNMPDLWQVMLPVNLNVMKKLCKVVKRQKYIYILPLFTGVISKYVLLFVYPFFKS